MKRTWSAGWGRSKRSKLRGAARATIKSLFQCIATLSPEDERLRAEHASYAKRTAELEQHNRMRVESATQRELKLQEKERDLTCARIEIATLSPENERLRAEHAYYAKRAAELEQHNRMLVESATQKELKLQEKERDL